MRELLALSTPYYFGLLPLQKSDAKSSNFSRMWDQVSFSHMSCARKRLLVHRRVTLTTILLHDLRFMAVPCPVPNLS